MIRKTITKNKETLSVPMTDRVWENLKRRAEKFPNSEYIFPHAAGETRRRGHPQSEEVISCCSGDSRDYWLLVARFAALV